MISIIIPAYNEEKFLPLLLNSLKEQTYNGFEIIVADSSEDRTRRIAKSFGCRIVEGGSPAKARNNGARYAKHDLLFIDSDVILPDKNFLKLFLSKAESFDIATCKVLPLAESLLFRMFYFFKNYWNKYLWIKKKHVSGQFLYIKKALFAELGGYDESLFLAEEHDLAERAVDSGAKFAFFMDVFVYNFPRRLEKEGVITMSFKSLFSEIYRIFFGKIKKKIYKYEFGKY